MFTFSQPVTPAVKNYLEAQLSLLGDISNKLFETAQQVNALNIRVAQTLADESVAGVRQVLEARDPYEALTVAIRQVQPTAERWRAYEQHLTHIAAGTQAELVKAAGAPAPETTRAAAALAEEMEQQA